MSFALRSESFATGYVNVMPQVYKALFIPMQILANVSGKEMAQAVCCRLSLTLHSPKYSLIPWSF